MSEVIAALADYGGMGLVLIVIIWLYVRAMKRQDDDRREDRDAAIKRELELADRIRELERVHHDALLPALERANAALLESAAAHRENSDAVRELREFLRLDHDSRENRVIRLEGSP